MGGGNADALVISDQNKADFFSDPALNAEGDKPVKIPLLICDAQWDTNGNTGAKDIPWAASTGFPIDLGTDKLVINPPLQGGDLFVSGTWESMEWDGAAWRNPKNGNLANGDLTINAGRDSLYKVTVNLPAGAGAAAPNLWVRINDLVIKGANGPYLGEYDRTTKRILVVYEAANAADFQNTIAHELGHAFHQTALGNTAGEPAHANQYSKQGSHCNYNTDKCLMYESGPIAGTLGEFCPVCHPYVILQDMSELA